MAAKAAAPRTFLTGAIFIVRWRPWNQIVVLA
jgi:hypothetical protein